MTELEQKLRDIADEKDLKILPENIKKDVEIFDVTGTYEGSGSSGEGVKLFTTEEEMQADSTAKEGDLAIVYKSEIQNMTADTQTQYITFPETVVLPEAFTGDVYCILRAVDETVMFDGQVMLNQSMFNFDGYTNTGMIRVSYTSNDGITYTREEFMGDSGDLSNPVDLGTSVGVYMSEEWNDNFGYFMQIDGSTFEGLFEYNTIDDTDNLAFYPIENLSFDINEYKASNITVSLNNPITFNYSAIKEVINNFSETDTPEIGIWYVNTNDELCFTAYTYSSDNTNRLAYDWDKTFLGITAFNSGRKYTINTYKANLDDGTYTKIATLSSTDDTYIMWTMSSKWYYIPISDMKTLPIAIYTYDASCSISLIVGSKDYVVNGTNTHNNTPYSPYPKKSLYIYAPTQLTLSSSNELLPGKIAYGRNGVVTGDNTIWDNIPSNVILNKLVNKQSDITSARTKKTLDMNVSDMMWISKDSDIQVNPTMTSNYPDIKQSFIDNGITLNSEVTFTEARYIGAVIGEQRDKYILTGGSYYAIYDIKSNTWYANKLPNDIVPNNFSKVMYTNKYAYIVYSTDVKEQNGITRMNLENRELSTQTILEILKSPSQLDYNYGSLVLDMSETYGYIFNNKNGVIVNFNSGETKTITDSHRMAGLFAIPNTNDVMYLVATSSNKKQYLCKRLTNTGAISKTYTCNTSGDVTVDFYVKYIRFIGLNNNIIHIIFDMVELTVFSLEYDINADALKYANTVKHDSGDYIMYGVSEYFNTTEFISDRDIKFSVNYNDHTIQEQKVILKNKYNTIGNINGLDMENELLFAGNCLLLKATDTSMTVMQYEPLFYKVNNVLSQEEYNQALETAQDILGKEETINE